jgi:iron(II)-dependent oxidoreductase
MGEASELLRWVRDARERTLALVADLAPDRLMGPKLPIVNPLLWESGHVGWFAERWILRHDGGRAPLRADGDELYDSSAVPHDTRWSLPLAPWPETAAYLSAVLERVVERVASGEADPYFVRLAVFHEDMHDEAFFYTRQTLAHPAPPFSSPPPDGGGPLPGDAQVPGGRFRLGAEPGEIEFVFDNEKWAHPVELKPFRIARAPVTQAEFAEFVDAGGYHQDALWCAAGWRWRIAAAAEHPVYWRRDGKQWRRRAFDRWVPLEPHRPVLHVNWYEADAFCRWAKRRLPTEAEWEAAAAGEPTAEGVLSPRRRRYPWGAAPPTPARAHLDGTDHGCIDVGALPEGDSAFGARQMIGNVWEWCADDFQPFPGFAPDPYREYSEPWFGTHKVLRGGCFATRARLIRNGYRNFYTPDRRDVWCGFRTCAR